jgi:hypothetical protein
MVAHLDSNYWRQRAEAARTRASQMRDPKAKRALREIADYEQLAEQAETIRKNAATASGHLSDRAVPNARST